MWGDDGRGTQSREPPCPWWEGYLFRLFSNKQFSCTQFFHISCFNTQAVVLFVAIFNASDILCHVVTSITLYILNNIDLIGLGYRRDIEAYFN